MKIRHIKPQHADFKAHLELLKAAFEGALNPKAEYLEMKEAVSTRNASFYQCRSNGGMLRFVGQAKGDTYFMWASRGKNLVNVAPAIIERIKASGFKHIEFVAYKPGMRRILRVLGFDEVERNNLSERVLETVHRLDLED